MTPVVYMEFVISSCKFVIKYKCLTENPIVNRTEENGFTFSLVFWWKWQSFFLLKNKVSRGLLKLTDNNFHHNYMKNIRIVSNVGDTYETIFVITSNLFISRQFLSLYKMNLYVIIFAMYVLPPSTLWFSTRLLWDFSNTIDFSLKYDDGKC